MNYVSNIIKILGGIRPAASLLGYPVSTVQNWHVRGRIPSWHIPKVKKAAHEVGFEIDMEKLIQPKPKRRRETKSSN